MGHELVHFWQNSKPFGNINTVLGTAGTNLGRIVSGVQGKPYQPTYRGITQEAQASMYYGPPNSTYQNVPAWLRSAALKGFLR